MMSRLMSHFKQNSNANYTRKQLVDLGFAKSSEDRTLRDALAQLVSDGRLFGLAFKELPDIERAKFEAKRPSANAVVYRYLSDVGTEDSSDF